MGNLGFPLVNNGMSFPSMCPRGALQHPCDSVISVSVLGLRGGRNLDRLQRTYYQGGVLAGEDEDSPLFLCSVLCCVLCVRWLSVLLWVWIFKRLWICEHISLWEGGGGAGGRPEIDTHFFLLLKFGGKSVARMKRPSLCVCVCTCLWRVFGKTSRHPVFGETTQCFNRLQQLIFVYFSAADTVFLTCLELHTHSMGIRLIWVYADTRAKCTRVNKSYCNSISFPFSLFHTWFFLFFLSAPCRSRHSTQRKCAGSSLPERVPAGHGVKSHGGVLLRPGPPLPAELHFQVQGHRGRGPETSVPPRVSQRVAPGRRFTQVRAQTLRNT